MGTKRLRLAVSWPVGVKATNGTKRTPRMLIFISLLLFYAVGSFLLNDLTWNIDIRASMQFFAGVMLPFGGLLSELIQGGSPGLTASNPGLVKAMGGFVFPVRLVV